VTERSDALFTLLEQTARITDVHIRYTDVQVPGGHVGHAVSHDGRRHLLVPLSDSDERIEDHTSRGVTISVRELLDNGTSSQYLDIACELPEIRDLFAELCDEMLRRLDGTAGRQPGHVCRRVLQRWRDLLAPATGDLLGRDRIAGLLAELHLLESAAALDPDRALHTWTGPDNARIDFTGAAAGIEVKATTFREALRVEIHGLEQLAQGGLQELYLYVEQLEPVPFGGDCVPDTVGRLTTAGVETVELLKKLRQTGYDHADADAYRHVQFRRTRRYTFRTTVPGFPKLTDEDLRAAPLPGRISRIRYTIDLSGHASVPGLVDDSRAAVAHLLEGPP
jgi:hypothetical protein